MIIPPPIHYPQASGETTAYRLRAHYVGLVAQAIISYGRTSLDGLEMRAEEISKVAVVVADAMIKELGK